MPVIDDLKFSAKTLSAKMERIGEIAERVENNPQNKKDLALLNAMTDGMEELYVQYQETVQKIAAYNAKQNPAIVEDLEPQIVKFEATYYNVKAVADITSPPEEKVPHTIMNQSQTDMSAMTCISLPKIQLAEFNGDIKSWTNFSELYGATVHINSQLSEIQKHMYLRSCLKGEALALISSLPITAANYQVAWKALQDRYNDTNLLTNTYLELLFNLPPVNRDAASLRTFTTALTEYIGALENIGHDVEGWAVPVLFLLVQKLSPPLRQSWEKHAIANRLPTLQHFITHISDEARILDAAQPSGFSRRATPTRNLITSTPTDRQQRGPKTFVINTASSATRCLSCNNNHTITQCPRFRNQSVNSRFKFVKVNRLCLLCLQSDHLMNQCTSLNTCKHCSSRHHTLLHFGTNSAKRGSAEIRANTDALETNTHSPAVVLLATVQARVRDREGKYQEVKILIDSASQGTFITRTCVDRLQLQSYPTSVPVFGMAQTTLGDAKGIVKCNFQRVRNVELAVEALIVEKITSCPTIQLPHVEWEHLRGLKLADASYRDPQAIDMLLGAEWFGSVFIGNSVVGPPGTPSAIETIWGYCLVGRVNNFSSSVETLCTSLDERLEDIISKFWETEEAPSGKVTSAEDQECEKHYAKSVARAPSGRYIVELPFRLLEPMLGNSRSAALRRFQLLERRLSKNAELRSRYNEFMRDYLEQGHMIPTPDLLLNENNYFIPHHCIFRSGTQISKFRVVFDASAKTTNGVSLNDALYTGPKLQADITELLIAFRLHRVVLVTDIRQMYRNILISEKNQNFQRIFWRFKPEDQLKEYFLATVTYGVSASPFLAIRTLHQLVSDEGARFPAAAQAIMSSTYMDDIVTSVPNVEAAIELQQELIELMACAGFQLRKWMSNKPEVLQHLDAEHCAMSAEEFSFEGEMEHATKILGLVWNPRADSFSYSVSVTHAPITKRTILSDIARLFDPLGYICPVTFFGKWLMQYLWQIGLNWDEAPPPEIQNKWHQCRTELPTLKFFALPRCVNVDDATHIEIHGFADSSEKGYAGVVYLRTERESGETQLSLLIAKSKVAPLKKVTLPRLELCAVVLAAKLVAHIQNIFREKCDIASVTVWTDSQVALNWIQSSPHRWKTYIANRVSQAQSYVPQSHYRHVPSLLNPADCASRGLLPQELLQHQLWLPGPVWLTQASHMWPAAPITHSEDTQGRVDAEARIISLQTNIGLQESFIDQLINNVSSLSALKYKMAWCLRFIHNCRTKEKLFGSLSAAELANALLVCIKLVQQQIFRQELRCLQQATPLSPPLRKLNPFVCDNGLLRVGGRLSHSALSRERKYPILLPKSHRLTELVIEYYHELYLHPGPQNLIAIIQNQFWIISARDAVKRRLGKCVTCFRTNPTSIQPKMGDLPAARLTTVKAFAVTGVDYGGPFEITLGKVRKAKIYKAYICLFVCFSTKAIHIELVSELTTDAFLAALKRFIARRGQVKEIHSDCGTNFVGAKRKLAEWAQFVTSQKHNDTIKQQLAERQIEWHLNPPSSPHFGGIWEAAIKSTKRLLRRVIGAHLLTYEEFYTVLVQIEATLNSRPLTPCSTDPNDLQALTPGHFLLLGAPSALPEPAEDAPLLSYRNRWKLLQQIYQSFWKRWSEEYLCTLQQRTKWTTASPNLEVGSLVLIKQENLPPLQWRLGRIINVFPGSDGIVRVAEVKTGSGIVKRPVVKLCPLPCN